MYIDDYRKLTEQQRKNIYKGYAELFNKGINQHIKNKITGIILENDNNVFTFKLYKPSNIEDKRLIYKPIEIVKIGKNNKTSIPVKIPKQK